MEHRWAESKAGTVEDDLDELVYLSNLIGADETLTQPGGGNSSVKRKETDFVGRTVDVLRVKGSGTDLASIGRGGFCGLRLGDLALLGRRAEMSDEDMMAFLRASMLDSREPAPSVETPLHSVLPYRFIVHTHDFATQALTDNGRPAALVREALGEEAAYIDYVRPGFPLARAVMSLGRLPEAARGLVLGRHGLVAWGDSARACYDNLHRLIERAEAFVAARGGMRTPVSGGGPRSERREAARLLLPMIRTRVSPAPPVILHLDDSPEALAFAADPRSAELARRGMATPEHILRCGRVPLHVGADLTGTPPAEAVRLLGGAVDRWVAQHRTTCARHGHAGDMVEPVPRVVILPGLGLVTAGRDKASALLANRCYRHVIRVMEGAEALGGFRFLDDGDAVEVEHWSLERAKVMQPERELARHVALVTGAASGIGLAIARRLAEEQAHLLLTDVREEALVEAVSAVAAACKDGRKIRALAGDATRAEDAAAAVTEAVLSFGGLDILVANAGFVAPGPIDEVTEQTWERHFDVNVKGTFLVVREAVRVMKAQRRGVILLNASKGAFAPTVDNAAYACSKAAVAALARNLAAELGPFGIRVNCFNADFVDTPLMRSLIAQRAAQRGVSIDAQTEEYRRRNLMQVGPLPASAVAEAALFLVSPRSRYTTGAALPIDGGIKEAMPR